MPKIENLNSLLKGFSLGKESTKNDLIELEIYSLPDDYLSMFAELNGGEGFVGEEYLILWKAALFLLLQYQDEKP